MNKLILALLTLAAMAIAVPQGLAAHCSTTHTTQPAAKGGDYYLSVDNCGATCSRVWIYEEANGITGLQRHDRNANDTCHGRISGDERIA